VFRKMSGRIRRLSEEQARAMKAAVALLLIPESKYGRISHGVIQMSSVFHLQLAEKPFRSSCNCPLTRSASLRLTGLRGRGEHLYALQRTTYSIRREDYLCKPVKITDNLFFVPFVDGESRPILSSEQCLWTQCLPTTVQQT
jgi:hypothetical protein